MPFFSKIPVIIEARQLTEDACWECWLNGKLLFDKYSISGSYHPGRREIHDAYVCIDTLEGQMTARLGDWIIKGVEGEFYPCKPDIFAKTYKLESEVQR